MRTDGDCYMRIATVRFLILKQATRQLPEPPTRHGPCVHIFRSTLPVGIAGRCGE